MTRTLIGAALGMATAVLTLGCYGAYDGMMHGWSTRPDLGPGVEAGLIGALFMMAFFWPVVGGVGAIIGGLAGLGSALTQAVSRNNVRETAKRAI